MCVFFGRMGGQLSPSAKASFPKKGTFEAAVVGPAWPPQSRQAGSRALPHGTRGCFTKGLASPASHAHSVCAPRPLSDPTPPGIHRNPVCTKGAPGSGPDPATVTPPDPHSPARHHDSVSRAAHALRPLRHLFAVLST